MAYIRTKYGVEYNPRGNDSESSGLVWVIVAITVVAVVSIIWSLVSHLRENREVVEKTQAAQRLAAPPPPAAPKAKVDMPRFKPIEEISSPMRPVVVRNLLLRLEEAERLHNIEMAATTIERIRSLPGQPAADIDDDLARRLGAFNLKRLFELHNLQWVRSVVVKPGDSAIRIARENGSTYASLLKLNKLRDASRIRPGQKLLVMSNPRFILVVRRRSRIADLSLNGRFFRRYDLTADVSLEPGAYSLGRQTRKFFSDGGIVFHPAMRDEIEMLLPPGTQISVSEM